MEKRTRRAVAGIGLTLGMGILAPAAVRADCDESYALCLYKAYQGRNRWIQQIRFVKCGVAYTACVVGSL